MPGHADPLASLIGLIWLAWLIYWWFLAGRGKAIEREESVASRLSHVVPLLIGVVLIATDAVPRWGWLSTPIAPRGLVGYWSGVALLLVGLGFTVWARHPARDGAPVVCTPCRIRRTGTSRY
ncbi:MAG TPA: hypothetical protein VGL55_14810 [Steroidobacteraceae bacterium]|jgi:hypothetical protein